MAHPGLLAYEPLVVSTRRQAASSDDTVDCIHYGAVAVVDIEGRLLYSVGDPSAIVFPRSALKPFQALPLIAARAHERLGFDERALALMCASHNAEPVHLAVVNEMLARADCCEADLQCGRHTPNFYSWQHLPPPPDLTITALHNTCSGKHAGFLAWCRLHRAPLQTYLDTSHPLQCAVRDAVSSACEVPAEAMPVGSDNCAAPNFGMPLRCLALGYAKLASGRGVFGELWHPMVSLPYLGSGQHRNDLDFMNTAPGDWVSKIGAGSIQAIGIRSAGLGIAVKVSDGNRFTQIVAAVEVLRQLGLVCQPERTPLARWARRAVTNHVGQHVGEITARFTLHKH